MSREGLVLTTDGHGWTRIEIKAKKQAFTWFESIRVNL